LSHADVARVRTKEASKASSFRPESALRLVVLVTMFVAAFCLRLYRIGEPLFDFVPVRQYHSALLARGFHEWLLTGNLKTMPPDGIIEPPILEVLASLSYLITGAEHLWIPRMLSAFFWMVGGVFLYLIARKIFSSYAALFSVAFFLFDPAVVLPSRAFMPDPLTIMMLVISVFTILRYHEQPTVGRLMVAIAASSVALFVKPGICLFQIFGVFVVPMVYRRGLIRTMSSVHLLLFTLLSLLPMGLYYVYGTVIRGFLQGQAQGKVVPHYLLEGYFWKGWLQQIDSMVGLLVFLGAVLGVILLRPGLPRALMVGMWGGYILFGLVFTYHIHTHDYYSLQFVPVIALSLGSLWDAMERHTARPDRRYLRRIGLLGLIIFVVLSALVEQHSTIEGIAYQASGEKPFPGRLKGTALIADYQARAETYKNIGDIVGHSSSTIYSAPDFGAPLRYYGRIDGEYWPTPGMLAWWRSRGRESKQLGGASSRRELFDQWYSEASPEYFIVIRSEGWGDDRMLRRLLKRHFTKVKKNRYYLIFDLRHGDYRPRSG
jgi:Dolichyl-phosphate-mannose-protein mannosyltransferase